jgi:hypothetical protein
MSSLNEIIGFTVEGTAEWRRRKAVEFPNDTRNLMAAEELDRLAVEINRLEGSAIHRQIVDAGSQLSGCPGGEDAWFEINETLSAELRSIGFHGSSTAEGFLEWYRDLLLNEAQALIDRAAPPPDLDEQVAKDPAVKAAKQAYDEAYAKAYAEARKRL